MVVVRRWLSDSGHETLGVRWWLSDSGYETLGVRLSPCVCQTVGSDNGCQPLVVRQWVQTIVVSLWLSDYAPTYLQTPLRLPEFFPIGQWNRFK